MPEASLDRATAAIGELSGSVRALHSEVVQSESLRATKIKWIQRQLIILVPAVVLLVLLAATNFIVLTRINQAASDARSTNTLLLGCLQQGTRCSEQNRKATAAVMDQIRQTQFAIALCQRINPVDKDPTGAAVVSCVQDYYPGLVLPPKSAVTPGPTTTN
jgi:hypothetical protein